MSSGLRFNSITIPPGTSVTSAYLTFTAFGTTNTGVTVDTVIQGEADLAPQPFTTYADFISRPKTSQMAYWQNVSPWVKGVAYQSPDLAQVVQAIVNQSGWQSGNSIVLFWGDTNGQSSSIPNASRKAYSYSLNPSFAVSLTIIYDSYVGYTPYPTYPTYSSSDITTLQTSIVGLQDTLKTMMTAISDLNRQGVVTNTQGDKVSASITSVQATVQSLQTSVGTLQNSVTTMNGNVTPIGMQIKSVTDSLVALNKELASLNTNVTAVKTEATALSKQLVIAEERDVGLQSKVSGLQIWLFILLTAQAFTLLLLYGLMKRGGSSIPTAQEISLRDVK
jgi:hypothetical protein